MGEHPGQVERASEEDEHTWTEQIEIAGSELVDRTKELIAQGNVRRLIIRTSDDEKLLEVPLTTGVVVGGGESFVDAIDRREDLDLGRPLAVSAHEEIQVGVFIRIEPEGGRRPFRMGGALGIGPLAMPHARLASDPPDTAGYGGGRIRPGSLGGGGLGGGGLGDGTALGGQCNESRRGRQPPQPVLLELQAPDE